MSAVKVLLISIGGLAILAIGIFLALEREQTCNGTILIAQKGEMLLQRNIGVADIQGLTISDTTSF